MIRFKLALIVLGAMLAFNGYEEYTVSSNASDEAVAVELARIESGDRSGGNFIKLGEHYAFYLTAVYQYEAETSYTDAETIPPDTKCLYAYYPIVSAEHPFMKALEAAVEEHGSLDDIPDGAWPELDDFKVLVKTERFATVGTIPDYWDLETSLEGLIVNDVETLTSEETSLLMGSFPQVDVDSLLILREGRTPTSATGSFGMMGAGAAMILVGLLWLVGGLGSTGVSQISSGTPDEPRTTESGPNPTTPS